MAAPDELLSAQAWLTCADPNSPSGELSLFAEPSLACIGDEAFLDFRKKRSVYYSTLASGAL